MLSEDTRIAHSGFWSDAFIALTGLGMLAVFLSGLFHRAYPENGVFFQHPSSAPTEMSLDAGKAIAEGSVLGQTDSWSFNTLKSENFALGQVMIGGDMMVSASDVREAAFLEVADVRGETFLDKNTQEPNVLITWKTTKLSRAIVRYGKSGSSVTETLEEDGYGLNHSVVISGLDSSSTYIYSIAARDRSGREVTTDAYAVYTGEKAASLFDLIAGAVTDTFGWAMKR